MSHDDLSGFLILTGGKQRRARAGELHSYERGLILRLDLATGLVDCPVSYESPPELMPDEHASVVFKAGSIHDGKLFLCTTTEVLVYRLDDWSLTQHFSHPWFNDLHHVVPTPEGTFLVAATGLDLILECDGEGQVLKEWPVIEGEPWPRLDPNVDYRKVANTKPHASHPNFVWRRGDEIWANRLKQKDAICLNAERSPLDLTGPGHDGVWFDGQWWFTTVDGRVHIADAQRGEVVRRIDLNEFAADDAAIGWCRSIFPVDAHRAWVGFSRLRQTKFKENLSWLKHRGRTVYRPTRIALYDFEAGRIEREIDLEPYGLHAIFSILHAERPHPLA